MVDDLKIIKKNYGEDMMHFCRDNFSTILETNGALSKIMLDNFYPNKDLYRDIKGNIWDEWHLWDDCISFKNYIYDIFDVNQREEIITGKTPEELLKSVGYTLYECKTEEDIQKFKKYYTKGEELCTFNGGRLNSCYVFFAVKDNVDEIKRENFKNPERQDQYGTSVISIQFHKDKSNSLSIKNRYNHSVSNPDATFSNNLDNIVEGLTNSFEKYFGFKQRYRNKDFELKNYVRANDAKLYKYNIERNNIYYCPDNIIIDNFEVHKYPKEEYIVMNYFILDLVDKEIYLCDWLLEDTFIDLFKNIEKVDIHNDKESKTKIVKIKTSDCGTSYIVLDKNNNIIKFANDTIERIEYCFLYINDNLEELSLPNVKEIGDDFMFSTKSLKEINLPSVEHVGGGFMKNNKLEKVYLPKVISIGPESLRRSNLLKEIYLPNLEMAGDEFLLHASNLEKASFPKLKKLGKNALYNCKRLRQFDAPNLKVNEGDFLKNNNYSNNNRFEIMIEKIRNKHKPRQKELKK